MIRCPPECEPISSLDCSLGHRADLGWWYASLKYRWVMWVTNHLQRFHRTVSGFKGQVTWKQTSDTLWIFKKEPHQSAAAAAAAGIIYSPLLRFVMYSLLIDFWFWRYFSPCLCSSILQTSFFSKVNIFIHYPAAITLTLHTKLTREAEKDRLLHWHAAAKTNSLTSEHGVLLDWICLPACLCQSQTETKRGRGREIWRRDHNA